MTAIWHDADPSLSHVLRWTVFVFALANCAFAAGPQQHVIGVTGEVRFAQGSSDRRVIVMVDSVAGGRDGMVDQWFIFESAEPFSSPNTRFRLAQLTFRDGSLRVFSAEDRVVYDFLVVRNDAIAPVPDGFTDVRHVGIGLSHSRGETRVPITRSPRGSVTADCVDDLCDYVLDPDPQGQGGGGTDCDAGGVGSTQCSASTGTYSCSVTCASGYYACCKVIVGGVSCKCYRG